MYMDACSAQASLLGSKSRSSSNPEVTYALAKGLDRLGIGPGRVSSCEMDRDFVS